MAEIRVELRDFNTTTNTFNIVGDLDIISSDDFPLSLTFKNFDIRDLNSRGGSFSKSFKVPATKNNNRIFGHIYKDGNLDINNVRKDIPSTIYSDNLPIISGKLRVSKVISNKDVIEYECIFLGDNMDWANKLKNKELKDLRFSSVAYTSYPPANIVNPTFSNPHGIGLTQPYYHGNYVFNQDKLVYPLLSIGEGISTKSQVTEADFVPCLYLKNIWDKIFQDVGYSVSSTFCESDFFKSLIVPLNFEKTGEQNNTKFGRIERGTDDDLTSEINLFNAADGTKTLNRAVGNPTVNIADDENFPNVYYVFDGDVSQDDFEGGNTSGSTGNVQVGSSSLNNTMLVKNETGSNILKWDVNLKTFSESFNVGDDETLDFEVDFYISRVSDDDSESGILSDIILQRTETYDVNFTEDNSPNDIDLSWSGSHTIDDPVGTKYVLFIRFDLKDYAGTEINYIIGSTGDEGGSVGLKFLEGSYFEISGGTTFSIGEEIDQIQFLLPKGSQSDFLSGVTQMFNLQYRTDAASKIVYIEPYDHFYKTTSDSVDWSDKIDYSKDIQDEFIYDIKSKLEFKYKDASDDAFLDRYNKKNNIDWGSYKEVDESGSFFDGEYKVENKFFSPTFNWTEPDYIDTTASGHTINKTPLIPIYHKEFSDLTTNEERAEKSFDIGARVLLLPPQNPLDYDDDFGEYLALMTSTETNAQTSYSFAPLPEQNVDDNSSLNQNFARGNFINIHNLFRQGSNYATARLNNGFEDVDLNLSYANVVFNSVANNNNQVTMFGLYYYYYSRMIKQLKEKPRLKIVYINLKKSDISLLDFQRLVYINGVYYRINKIIDFQPHIEKSTKVELLEYSILGRDEELLGDSCNLQSITL